MVVDKFTDGDTGLSIVGKEGKSIPRIYVLVRRKIFPLHDGRNSANELRVVGCHSGQCFFLGHLMISAVGRIGTQKCGKPD